MTPDEMSEAAPRPFCERCVRKTFHKSYEFIKVFSSIEP